MFIKKICGFCVRIINCSHTLLYHDLWGNQAQTKNSPIDFRR
jgi:hypothetical protein